MFHPVYHPVIFLPEDYEVYDFSVGYNPERLLSSPFGIGKYNEHRPGMYKGDLFEENQRTVHIGIDIGAPVGCAVHAFANGVIFKQGYNALPWDYGATIVTKHAIDGRVIYALHGHLSKHSLSLREEGEPFDRGEIIAYLGDKTENGGWNAHLHFQLSWTAPPNADMPGVVSLRDRQQAVLEYPDPQMVLGKLYD